MIPLVVASERGEAQTGRTQWPCSLCTPGVERPPGEEYTILQRVRNHLVSRTGQESQARDGDSPVDENPMARRWCVSTTGHEKPCGKRVRPRTKAKYTRRPIVH